MKLTIIHTGKTKSSCIQAGCEDYHERIKKYLPFHECCTNGVRSRGSDTPDIMKKKEGEQLLGLINPADSLILFDEKGRTFNSVAFASFLEKMFMSGRPLVFATGGAYGFSDNVYKRADEKISLSEMTFSHQLVRIIIAEQIYRALTILRGEKYHH